MEGDPTEVNSNSNKRKFKHETSDLPVPKHTCLDNNIQSRYNQGSGKDSNSLSEDADSVMSVSNDELQYLKISPYDHQNTNTNANANANATSSVNWSGTSTGVNSFDTKTSPPYDFYDSPTFDDHMTEFSTSEYSKQLQDEASLENLFCSTGVVSSNFVLSSGRWNINQDTEQGTEKLTIDKEFEQYFSSLML